MFYKQLYLELIISFLTMASFQQHMNRSCGKIRGQGVNFVQVPTSSQKLSRIGGGPGSDGSRKVRETEMSCVIP